MMKWMKKALLKLRNGGQIKVEVNLTTQSLRKKQNLEIQAKQANNRKRKQNRI